MNTKIPGRTLIAACAVCLVVVGIPAKAQVIVDMTLITCGQYMGKDHDTQDVIAAWMSGYYNAAKNQSMVDLARFERNRKAVEKYCKKNKLETLRRFREMRIERGLSEYNNLSKVGSQARLFDQQHCKRP